MGLTTSASGTTGAEHRETAEDRPRGLSTAAEQNTGRITTLAMEGAILGVVAIRVTQTRRLRNPLTIQGKRPDVSINRTAVQCKSADRCAELTRDHAMFVPADTSVAQTTHDCRPADFGQCAR